MIRTQIQLTEAQARALRDLAARSQRSMADLVRESIAEYLARRRPLDRRALARRARDIAGSFRSGTPDLAPEHDRHLAESFVNREPEESRPPRDAPRGEPRASGGGRPRR